MSTPAQPLPHDTWTQVLAATAELYRFYSSYHFPVIDQREHFFTLMFAPMVSRIREYSLVSPLTINAWWDVIRENEELLSFLLAIVADLPLRTGLAFNDIAANLALGIAGARSYSDDPKAIAMDEQFLDDTVEYSTFATLLQANPWLTVLLLIRRTGLVTFETPTLRDPKPPQDGDTENASYFGGN